MNINDAPKKQPVPFAVNGQRENLLASTPAGDNTASYSDGFPPVTMILKAAGGLPPKGQDMNQILFELSNLARWSSAGALNVFDADFSNSINGYPLGAILVGDDGVTIYQSTTDNNKSNPNNSSSGWRSLNSQYLSRSNPFLDIKNDGNIATAFSNLGLKSAASRDVGTTVGTVAAGDDGRFIKCTGTYTIESAANVSGEIQGGSISLKNTLTGDNVFIYQSAGLTNGSPSSARLAFGPTWNGERKYFFMEGNTGNGIAANGSWVSSSDKRIKTNIVPVKEALAGVIRSFNGCTYDKDGTPSVGLIAQDVQKECPSAVISIGDIPISTGETIENVLALDTAGIAAAYHTEAIKTLFSLVELAITDTAAAKELLGEIKQQIAEGS